ncbi:MAG: PxKF domain-containing protein, partial [Acidobacteriota bacterium]
GDLSVVDSIQIQLVGCAGTGAGAAIEGVDPDDTAGKSGLSFNVDKKEYNFKWKTKKSKKTKCFLFFLDLNDDTQHIGKFKIIK